MMSHSWVEGMLLRSHASGRSRARIVGRRFAGKSAPRGDMSGVSPLPVRECRMGRFHQWPSLALRPRPSQAGLPTHTPVAFSCGYRSAMAPEGFVPLGFAPPTSLVTDRFRLEPLGPQHNDADHAAWTSSIDHIRATPGYPDGTGRRLTGCRSRPISLTCGDMRPISLREMGSPSLFLTRPTATLSSAVSTCIPRLPLPMRSPSNHGCEQIEQTLTSRSQTQSPSGSLPSGRGGAWTGTAADRSALPKLGTAVYPTSRRRSVQR